ncbi:MAG: DNA-processing protein DprA [Paracoccaceae bacterium]|nr:DNA-processing protein DprA [Paracoccaceae bacterium]
MSWLRLLRSRRVGPTTFRRLIAQHEGSAEAALAELPKIAAAAGAEGYVPCPPAQARAELEAGRRAGAVPLFLDHPAFPDLLRDRDDTPPLLWARGELSLLARPAVGLVGARNASSLGLRMARSLARGLGAAGFVTVSGLARGIDAAAHGASLETGTIAVLAGGVDVPYPPENEGLLRQIAGAGLVLSEMPPGLRPQARHFPRRNRIIAALGRALVVVEAAARSGSLITARDAADLGREVLAVPGHPFDARAAGCNILIRDGAALVRGPDDVRAALGPAISAEAGAAPPREAARPAAAPRSETPRPALDAPAIPTGPDTTRHRSGPPVARAADASGTPPGRPDGARPRSGLPDGPARAAILERLGAAPIDEDSLLRDSGLARPSFAATLTELEMDGLVRRAPGGLLSRG